MKEELNEIEVLDVESEVYVIGAEESDVLIAGADEAFVVEMDDYVADMPDVLPADQNDF